MKNVFIKIILTILSAAFYNAINTNPSEISGAILSIIFLVVIIGIWRTKFSSSTNSTKNGNAQNKYHFSDWESIKIQDGKGTLYGENLKYILNNFLLFDGINPAMYKRNIEASDNFEKYRKGLNETPSFHNFIDSHMDRGLEVPSWFYYAYPDVAKWMNENLSEFERKGIEPFTMNSKYVSKDGLTILFFRKLIDNYKESNSRLECS